MYPGSIRLWRAEQLNKSEPARLKLGGEEGLGCCQLCIWAEGILVTDLEDEKEVTECWLLLLSEWLGDGGSGLSLAEKKQ